VAPFFGAFIAVGLQNDPLNSQLTLGGLLMAVGALLHLIERHGHLHVDLPQEHSHPHIRDEHHRHTHDSWDGREPHTYMHVHVSLMHAHAHYPDLHHRHPH
jgi:hypothetical protein